MLGEDHLRGSKPAEDDVLDVKRQLFDASDGVLNACPHAVDNMKIGFQFLPKHPDRIQHAILTVDMIMLDNGMQEGVLRRDAHFACVDFYVLDVLLINLIAVFGQHHTPSIIKTLKMRPGDSDVNASDHDVAFLFGIDHCFVHAFHRGLKINDLAFAHTA